MPEEKRLIGNDGKLMKGTVATATVTSFASKSWYKIITKASTGSKFGGLDVGDFFYNPSASPITAAAGDTASLITLTDVLDINGWGLKVTGTEVEVSTLADKFKKYRRGKMDAEGSLSFTFIKGITDMPGGTMNQFFDIAEISAAGAVTFTPKNQDPLYFLGFLSTETAAGTVFDVTLLVVELYEGALTVKDSESMNQDSKFRLATDSDPVLYRITNA